MNKVDKTVHCKHRGSCQSNVGRSFVSTFQWVFVLKFCINKVLSIAKIRKSKNPIGELFGWKSNKDNLRFALVMASINATYKIILCAIRRHSQKSQNPDRFGAPIAGSVAGLLIGLDDKKRRQFITVLLLSKLVDILLNRSMQNADWSPANREAIQSGADRPPKAALIFVLFVLSIVWNKYAALFEPEIVNVDMFKFSIRFCMMCTNWR